MRDNTSRRIAAVARHLQPDGASSSAAEVDGHCLHMQATAAAASPSSYAKVHGAVSRDAATWTEIPVVQKQTLTEVIYQKAADEGIAKVGLLLPGVLKVLATWAD